MAFVRLKHGGMQVPRSWQKISFSPQIDGTRPELNGTYDKVAFAGRFTHPDGVGSYNIERVGFKFGSTVTKSGGSGLTVSLQDVSSTTAKLEPDGTQDQTYAIANGDTNFTANAWYRTGVLSTNRTISHGDYVALVVEWDGSGRQGSDLIRWSQLRVTNDDNNSRSMRYNGSVWSDHGYEPNVVFEIDDGSFAGFDDDVVIDGLNAYFYDNANTPDEYANSYTPEANVKIDAFTGVFRPPSDEDIELIVYEGTTALHTTTINSSKIALVDNHYWTAPLDSEVELTAGTEYYLAVRPTQGTVTMRIYYRDVNDPGHLALGGFGDETAYSRTDSGAWSQVSTTRQLVLGVRISSIDDGAGGGGGGATFHPLAEG